MAATVHALIVFAILFGAVSAWTGLLVLIADRGGDRLSDSDSE